MLPWSTVQGSRHHHCVQVAMRFGKEAVGNQILIKHINNGIIHLFECTTPQAFGWITSCTILEKMRITKRIFFASKGYLCNNLCDTTQSHMQVLAYKSASIYYHDLFECSVHSTVIKGHITILCSRIVKEDEKSFALGLLSFTMNLFGRNFK